MSGSRAGAEVCFWPISAWSSTLPGRYDLSIAGSVTSLLEAPLTQRTAARLRPAFQRPV
ncbi:hypothetical protein ACRAWD_18125 [Caulobacter segnis]